MNEVIKVKRSTMVICMLMLMASVCGVLLVVFQQSQLRSCGLVVENYAESSFNDGELQIRRNDSGIERLSLPPIPSGGNWKGRFDGVDLIVYRLRGQIQDSHLVEREDIGSVSIGETVIVTITIDGGVTVRHQYR